MRTDWFRYGFETIAVVIGILVAFALDNWNENRITEKELNTYTEKLINDLQTDTLNIKMQQNEMRKYFDSDLSESDFFEKVGWLREDQLKLQGLLHRHSELSQFHRLAYYMDLHGARIKDLTKHCLELLDRNYTRAQD